MIIIVHAADRVERIKKNDWTKNRHMTIYIKINLIATTILLILENSFIHIHKMLEKYALKI